MTTDSACSQEKNGIHATGMKSLSIQPTGVSSFKSRGLSDFLINRVLAAKDAPILSFVLEKGGHDKRVLVGILEERTVKGSTLCFSMKNDIYVILSHPCECELLRTQSLLSSQCLMQRSRNTTRATKTKCKICNRETSPKYASIESSPMPKKNRKQESPCLFDLYLPL